MFFFTKKTIPHNFTHKQHIFVAIERLEKKWIFIQILIIIETMKIKKKLFRKRFL